MSIRSELRRLAARLRALERCPAPECGLTHEEAAGTRALDTGHASVLAWWRCSGCGGVPRLNFTLGLDVPPGLETAIAEHFARELLAEGVCEGDGWEVRPDIAESVARLGTDTPPS
jgi:hypothetical protein